MQEQGGTKGKVLEGNLRMERRRRRGLEMFWEEGEGEEGGGGLFARLLDM